MKILVTGASGYIGFEVAKAFVRSGYEVIGLTRSPSGAKHLQQQEITPLISTLEELSIIDVDAIVHCAFESVEKDSEAVDTLLAFNPKVFVYTSGVWVYGSQTGLVDESTPLQPLENVKRRPETEQKVLKSPPRSIVIRPAHIYGFGKGLYAMLFENLSIVGDGSNFWTTVHATDLADLYVLAVEKNLTKTILNGVTASVLMKGLAEAIGKIKLETPHFIPFQKALEKLGPLAYGLAVNQPNISGEKAFLLGWRPKQPPLLEGVNHYFNTWNSYN